MFEIIFEKESQIVFQDWNIPQGRIVNNNMKLERT